MSATANTPSTWTTYAAISRTANRTAESSWRRTNIVSTRPVEKRLADGLRCFQSTYESRVDQVFRPKIGPVSRNPDTCPNAATDSRVNQTYDRGNWFQQMRVHTGCIPQKCTESDRIARIPRRGRALIHNQEGDGGNQPPGTGTRVSSTTVRMGSVDAYQAPL